VCNLLWSDLCCSQTASVFVLYFRRSLYYYWHLTSYKQQLTNSFFCSADKPKLDVSVCQSVTCNMRKRLGESTSCLGWKFLGTCVRRGSPSPTVGARGLEATFATFISPLVLFTCRADAPITAHMWEHVLCDDVQICGYVYHPVYFCVSLSLSVFVSLFVTCCFPFMLACCRIYFGFCHSGTLTLWLEAVALCMYYNTSHSRIQLGIMSIISAPLYISPIPCYPAAQSKHARYLPTAPQCITPPVMRSTCS